MEKTGPQPGDFPLGSGLWYNAVFKGGVYEAGQTVWT